jgi:hypothetical protein
MKFEVVGPIANIGQSRKNIGTFVRIECRSYMKNLSWIAGFIIAISVMAGAQTPPNVSLEELDRRAEIIKPSPNELKWRNIPWVLDLGKGQQLAQQERRPIFLWVTGDDPLERC